MAATTDTAFAAAAEAVRLRRAGESADLSDQQLLQLYALYKQATIGDCAEAFPSGRGSLVGKAKWTAWHQKRGLGAEEAKLAYVHLVSTLGLTDFAAPAGFLTTRRRPSEAHAQHTTSAGTHAVLDPHTVAELSKAELVSLIDDLQSQVIMLRVGHVYKEGSLQRYRETMVGGDWQKRFYVVKPGYLRCYKSNLVRKLRLEVPLFHGVRIKREQADSKGRHHFQIELPEASMKRAELRIIRLGASTAEEADEWIAAIRLAANEDDRRPSSGTTSRRVREGKTAAAETRAVPKAQTQHPAPDAATEESEKKSGELSPPPPTATIPSRAPQLTRYDTRPSKVIHKSCRPSVISSSATEPPSLRGLFNLVLIVAIVSNLRLVLENLLKYGVLISATGVSGLSEGAFQCFLCGLGLNIFVVLCFGLERAAAKGYIASKTTIQILHASNCILTLAFPIEVIYRSGAPPLVGSALLTCSTVLFMKLVSYAHTNNDLRTRWAGGESSAKSGGDDQCAYPHNLSLWDMYRFLAFPTLVYQTSYPRSKRIRKRWLTRRIIELCLCVGLMLVIIQQFIHPLLLNAREPLRHLNAGKLAERLLKLAIPNLLVWLCMFYSLFHCWLNILAEVTFFGDRLFYKAWWNATRLDQYWRLWNLPVHNWLVRHAFFPALHAGLSKTQAMLVVFLLSALLHEVLVSVPCRVIRMWAFLGMLAQMPLIWITKWLDRKMKGSQIGNVIFWVSFCVVGQPLCILLYYMEFIDSTDVPASVDGVILQA